MIRDSRIQFIDALRGWTMFLVVFHHICYYNLKDDSSFIDAFFCLFRMPLFFFVSGFVAFVALNKSGFDFRRETIKKARVLLIPTIVFGVIYVFLKFDGNVIWFVNDTSKLGYWFTLVSFEIFFIYFLVRTLIRNNRWRAFVLIFISLLFCMLKLPMKIYPALCEFGNITSMHYTFNFMQFFVFGLLASEYRERFFKLLDNKHIMFISLILFGVFAYVKFSVLIDTSDLVYKIIETVLEYILGYLGIIILFAIFRKYENCFDKKNKLGKMMQYVGRHTLDIYMLHYFFLPYIPFASFLFVEHCNIALELLILGTVSAFIICICLILSNAIRVSDILAYYLFGAKKY